MTYTERHIGASASDRTAMLEVIKAENLDALLRAAVPPSIYEPAPAAGIPAGASEEQVLARLRQIASKNVVRVSMIGQGYYDTITPAVIQRNILENPAWYTAYTPYQPEISQGRLEALLNFQTMVGDLTGLPIAGASMLDEATAAAEAMLLARRASKAKGSRFYVERDTFAQTRAVIETRANAVGLEIVEFDAADAPTFEGAFGVLIQQPGASGRVLDDGTLTRIAVSAHEANALVAVALDLLAAILIGAPGDLGADIALGSSQRFGVPMGFGGPHAGFISVRQELVRQLPGRLVGVSRDASGAPAYRLALQTREQHIRREKATSNICTAQVLLAVMAAMYAVWHGPEGLSAIAQRVHAHAVRLAESLDGVENHTFFDTLTVRTGDSTASLDALRGRGILAGRVDSERISLSVDETTTQEHLALVVEALGGTLAEAHGGSSLGSHRTSAFLTHPVFSAYRSETAMMRYMRRLSDKDFALDRGMIPLGSCTMKLNSAVEMAAISWPEFSRIHPFAPADDVRGYQELIDELIGWLAALTGYAGGSVQPNAGSQGEYAGLLAIRRYLDSSGQSARTVCLIPSSAHGTNAASAVLAGMRVVVVACDDGGNVDVEDLAAKIEQHGEALAAIMITYPSTHGVYEESVVEICRMVHAAGGQVYIDGANLNALVGVARPGAFGGDVSHLNLHKTFAIPHGGGGPGVGPVMVGEHLLPYLPGHPLDPFGGTSLGAISAAPYGSPSILPISWAYIALLGAQGLREATASAVLAANYVAARLEDDYPTLYRGPAGLVAHECILDTRIATAEAGITVDDIAKRLIDYGFHAPTMSFPVAGTLMVEPTESEDKVEIDRFCDAMRSIRQEIRQVAAGSWPKEDNPLVGAPHTARSLVEAWDHPYERTVAAYPAETDGKYWPPVGRIDGAWGDRNLHCACPSPADFE